jgi:hypothetical protein
MPITAPPLDLASAMVGAWRLVSFETHRSDGSVRHPLSPQATGLLVYTDTGWMCGQLMRPNRPGFPGAGMTQGTDAEVRAAATGYVAYAGPFDVDERARTVTHHVQLSLFPNLIGTDQVRVVTMTGDRLELTTPPELSHGVSRFARLAWERIKPPAG